MILNEGVSPSLSLLYAGVTHYDYLHPISPLLPHVSVPTLLPTLFAPPPLVECDSSDDEDELHRLPDHLTKGNQRGISVRATSGSRGGIRSSRCVISVGLDLNVVIVIYAREKQTEASSALGIKRSSKP